MTGDPDKPDDEATRVAPLPGAAAEDDATQFVPLDGSVPPGAGGDGSAPGGWFAAAPSAAPVQQVLGEGGVHIGTLINNNYKVTEILSAGGMGEVYKGENVFTKDPVAIKVILDKLAADQKAADMFLREAKTLSQLTDDAIVRYYNFVRDPGINRFCLIMEFIEGVPLSDHVARYGPVPVVATEALMVRLARGLDKAHRNRVIHRDLSPDNVMLPLGIIGEARLIDFGIAKSIAAEGRTATEEFAGKFKFVAPEQLGHFGGEIGPKTDIYGLGLLICAAVLGKPLDMGTSIEEAAQLRQKIPDLSAVPPALRPLLAHMLEPDPAARPDSMAQVERLLAEPWEIPERYFDGPRPKRPAELKPAIEGMKTTPGLALPPTRVAQAEAAVSVLSGDAEEEGAETGGGGAALKLMAGAALVLGLGLGGYAYSRGVFSAATPEAETTPDGVAEPAEAERLTPRRPETRDGFLAEFDSGPCTYIARETTGPFAGSLAGYGQGGGLGEVGTAYEAQFGARPAVQPRLVTPEQCPVLDFARTLQGRSVLPAALSLEAARMPSGAAINGVLTDQEGRNVWFALVSPLGLAYPITDRLAPPVQGARSFALPLQLAEGSAASPQLFMAVVTEQPLVSTAQVRPGSAVSDLLPLILQEIGDTGGQGVAALTHVLLEPAPPAPPPPPAEEDGTAVPDAPEATGGQP